ncbi:MAG: polysaccharide deacetylase [Acidobacteriota bacterium]|nr:polysaccharide deacetylase [Acidobacteriota bacterium]
MIQLSTPIFDPGVFTISLDFELIWGTLDLFGPGKFHDTCRRERIVVERLLDLFVEFEVNATWCTVGHLFLGQCSPEGGVCHPDIVRPKHGWVAHEWFAHDPCGSEASHPVFYGRSLVEKIRSCSVPQEIGCHTFSHVIFGDGGCSREAAASEVAACVKLAGELGIQMRSFVFPRNRVGHLDVLRAFHFTCYRSPEPQWYEAERWPRAVKRAGHLFNVLAAMEPPVSLPERDDEGLWRTPASMLWFPMKPGRAYNPVGLTVKRAKKGLDAAARHKRVFHLWFHPTDMAEQMERMLAGLREVFEHARALRDRGDLQVLSMGALVH